MGLGSECSEIWHVNHYAPINFSLRFVKIFRRVLHIQINSSFDCSLCCAS